VAKGKKKRKAAADAGKGARRASKLEVARPSVPILRFLGATETVTGSRFLVDTPRARILVDCGLFQGLKSLRERNWATFPVDPASIDAVILTHAHVDHSGYIPALVRNGFKGSVYATPATCALAEIVLPDSGHLHEEDAAYANRKGFSKHVPALPLYTEEDARRSLTNFRRTAFDTRTEVADRVYATFRHAGHILGAAMVALEIGGSSSRTVGFSGDLGRPQHPILQPPAAPPDADFLLVESTYGDRRHEDVESMRAFEDALARTAERGGMVVIPSFAVDRTEVVLFHLRSLMLAKKIPEMPVWVDSPMALATLKVYRQALAEGSAEIKPELRGDQEVFDAGNLIEARHPEESMAINAEKGPGIIISASGMATGGRVLHHLAHRLSEPQNTVLLVGYQADGTRGRSLLNGARSLKMLGRYIAVHAEVVNVPAFSVHADQAEILAWLKRAPRTPMTTFVVHGETNAAGGLHDLIEQELGWTVVVPRHFEQVRLD
jgi:metallo-beta-lactamase family protein